MSNPSVLPRGLITKGMSWTPAYIMSLNGVIMDLSDADVEVTLFLRHQTSGTQVSRSTANADETTFPNGTGDDGQIVFNFAPSETDALEAGFYNAEIVYEDDSTAPDIRVVHSRGIVEVIASLAA